MGTLKKNLNYIALGLILAALAAWFVWPSKKAVIAVLGLGGLLAIAAYIVLNFAAFKRGFQRKSFLYGGNSILMVVLVLAILVLVNYFLSKHHVRMDLTASKVHSLSDQSLTVLRNLKADVSLKGFFRLTNESRTAMENLLKIYAYNSGRIKYEFIDPDKNPGLVKRYAVTQDGTTILEAGDKETRVTTTSEEDVTNAIIKVTRASKKVIYFLEGHGEQTIEESGDAGYATAKGELEKLSYEVKKLSLALAANFPADCSLLVVPGPQKDLLPNELETIKGYLDKGGRVLFMIDPQTAPGLTPYLAGFGIKLDDDIIIDQPSLLGGDYLMPVMSSLEFHEITKNFRYATIYPLARSVDVIDPKPENVASSQVLGKSGDYAYLKKNFVLKSKMTVKDIEFDPQKDRRGPIPMAALATLKPEKDPAGKSLPEGRILVFGDADFVANRLINYQGNGNLFLNAVNWLTEESDLISIQPKTQSPRTIQLTPVQMSLINLIVLYVLPLAVLLFGLSVWLRRRSL